MRIRNLLACAAAGASLLGCSTLDPTGYPGPGAGPPCNTSVCHVVIVAAPGCRIRDPGEIHVKAGNRNAQIHFTIKNSPGYAFTDDGIFLKRETKGELHSPERTSPTLFKYNDKNSFPGTYPYGIRLTENGNRCPDFDPAIVNDM